MPLPYFKKHICFVSVAAILASISSLPAFAQDSFLQTNQETTREPYNSLVSGAPLKAGDLSLEDVIKANPRNPSKPPRAPQISGDMISDGMKSIMTRYQVDKATITPVSSIPVSSLDESEKAAEVGSLSGSISSSSSSDTVKYEPGTEPKTLDSNYTPTAEAADASQRVVPISSQSDTASSAATTVPEMPVAGTKASDSNECYKNVKRWLKTCTEAGYPESFAGRIIGETREVCDTGELQDFWVENTCKPESASQETPKQEQHTLGVLSSNDTIAIPSEEKISEEEIVVPEKTVEAPPVKSEEKSEGFFSFISDWFGGEDSKSPEPAETKASSDERTALAPAIQQIITEPYESFCGEAAEMLAHEAPVKNLCRLGAASEVSGDGPWHWTCTKDGAVSECTTLSLSGLMVEKKTKATPEASVLYVGDKKETAEAALSQTSTSNEKPAEQPTEKPVCGFVEASATTPKEGLCTSGTPTAVKTSGNKWKWSCTGATKVSCNSLKIVNAACGKANGTSVSAAPSSKLCSPGVAGTVSKDGDKWSWTCKGENNGNDAECSALEKVTAPVEKTTTTAPVEPTVPTEEAKKEPVTASPVSPAPEPIATSEEPAKQAEIKQPEEEKSLPEEKPLDDATNVSEQTYAEMNLNNEDLELFTNGAVVSFTESKTELKSTLNKKTLNRAATLMSSNKDIKLSLMGYAGGLNVSVREAKRLSLARTLVVRDYLVSKGIEESRITVFAWGLSPDEDTERVDLKFSK